MSNKRMLSMRNRSYPKTLNHDTNFLKSEYELHTTNLHRVTVQAGEKVGEVDPQQSYYDDD